MIAFLFFFSSRRRHTRFDCDWSSDVCSSDLGARFVAKARTRVGVVALGYADGYPQFAPNGTPVLIDGQPGTLIGRVSMDMRSEEHTSELQSQSNLVCRLLLEKKKKKKKKQNEI